MNEIVLIHHGVRGQKWGVRRFQNADGSLTKAGKKRLAKSTAKSINKDLSDIKKAVYDRRNYSGAANISRYKLSKLNAKKDKTSSERKLKKINKKIDKETKLYNAATSKYNDSSKKISSLVNKVDHKTKLLQKNKDLSYKYVRQVFNDSHGSYKDSRALTKQYGKTRLAQFANTTISGGSKIKVTTSDSRRGKSKSYNSSTNRNANYNYRFTTRYYY